jgi:ribonuclease P protein component
MLPLKNRIKKKKEIDKVFKEGKNILENYFVLKFYKNKLFYSRFAFIFSIKEEKKAPKRNRGKRVFREAVRKCMPSIKENIDGIFIIKKESEKKSFLEIENKIKETFKKIEII